MVGGSIPDTGARGRRLLFLCAVSFCIGTAWGGTYILAKIAMSTGHDPMGISVVTSLISVVLTTGLLLAQGGRVPMGRKAVIFYLACGLFGTAVPNTLSYTIIEHLPVGIVAILTAMVPMMTLLLGWSVGLERFALVRTLGIVLGLAAVALMILPDASLPEAGQSFWVMLGLVIALAYAAENIIIGMASPAGSDALSIMTGLSWGGLFLLLPIVAMRGTWVDITPMGMPEIALLVMGVVHVVCYFGFVWIIGTAGPVFAAQIGYVVTLSGVFWGMVIYGERHSGYVWLALALMMVGMALVKPRE